MLNGKDLHPATSAMFPDVFFPTLSTQGSLHGVLCFVVERLSESGQELWKQRIAIMINVHACVCLCMFMCVHINMCVHTSKMYIYMFVHVCVCVHILVCTQRFM